MGHFFGFVGRMPIDNEKNHMQNAKDQSFQKFANMYNLMVEVCQVFFLSAPNFFSGACIAE